MRQRYLISLSAILVLLLFSVDRAFAATLVEWTFEGDVTTPSTGTGTASAGSDLNTTFFNGNPGRAWAATNWVTAETNSTNYFQFCISTVGFTNIQFRFDDDASGTGPSNWEVRWSTDSFVTSTSAATGTTAGSFSTSPMHSMALGSGAEEQSNLCARIYATGASSDGGTWRIDNVVFDGTTAIELADFGATLLPSGNTYLAWQTASEIDHAGFNVYRSSAETFDAANATQLNAELIAAQGSFGQGASYSLIDNAVPAGVWYYYLEDVDIYGAATVHAPVRVDLSQPTSAALTAVSGSNSAPVLPIIAILTLFAALFAFHATVGKIKPSSAGSYSNEDRS